MSFLTEALLAILLVTIVLVGLLVWRPSLTAAVAGKILAFVALFVLPTVVTTLGTSSQLEHSKSTRFCLSCHVMEPYGQSLYINDSDYLPANHFQNKRIPREQACFSCHTTYTLFGGIEAKLKGVKHLYVYYLGELPETLSLYEPYQNRECLHCHAGARSFEEDEIHVDFRDELETGATSCLECHDLIHDVTDLEGLAVWKEEGVE